MNTYNTYAVWYFHRLEERLDVTWQVDCGCTRLLCLCVTASENIYRQKKQVHPATRWPELMLLFLSSIPTGITHILSIFCCIFIWLLFIDPFTIKWSKNKCFVVFLTNLKSVKRDRNEYMSMFVWLSACCLYSSHYTSTDCSRNTDHILAMVVLKYLYWSSTWLD